jgi:hypothetical protein
LWQDNKASPHGQAPYLYIIRFHILRFCKVPPFLFSFFFFSFLFLSVIENFIQIFNALHTKGYEVYISSIWPFLGLRGIKWLNFV